MEITYPFEGFPFFGDRRRPILVKGEAVCRAASIAASAVGEPGAVRWRIAKVTLRNEHTAEALDMSQDSRFRIDFDRWLKGKHGYSIETALRHQGETETDEK